MPTASSMPTPTGDRGLFSNDGPQYSDRPIPHPYTEWNWLGTFEQQEFNNEYIYYVSNNAFHHASHTVIPPYRAYIWGRPITATQAKNITFVLEEVSGEATAIKLRYDNENLNPMHNQGSAAEGKANAKPMQNS